MIDPILSAAEHRPYPLPSRPWIMTMTWHDLLFAHWQVPAEQLRPLVPEVLSLDTFDGSAWVAVTPFHMTRVGPRGLPSIQGLSAFPELNVRTYVTLDGRPGVFFFSLDTPNLPAVWGARIFYRLPYFHAHIKVRFEAEDVRYLCRRIHGPRPAEFQARYRPVSTARIPLPGTLEHFLGERYCLYAVDGDRAYRADIHHVPWPLQEAEAVIEKNTMALASGIRLPDRPPLLHFARELKVLVWAPLRLR
jgi:hypothetical protein